MQPLPMNELVKSQLEEVGFQVDFKVMDWNSLIEVGRSGVPKYPEIDGYNGSRALLDPVSAHRSSRCGSPLVAGRQQLGPFLRRRKSTELVGQILKSSTGQSAWRC